MTAGEPIRLSSSSCGAFRSLQHPFLLWPRAPRASSTGGHAIWPAGWVERLGAAQKVRHAVSESIAESGTGHHQGQVQENQSIWPSLQALQENRGGDLVGDLIIGVVEKLPGRADRRGAGVSRSSRAAGCRGGTGGRHGRRARRRVCGLADAAVSGDPQLLRRRHGRAFPVISEMFSPSSTTMTSWKTQQAV